jgi:hypothetical protein
MSRALGHARVYLYRALEANRSMMRADQLYRARDALKDAGFPRWADLAEAAAMRVGGGDSDMRALLFDVDAECAKR